MKIKNRIKIIAAAGTASAILAVILSAMNGFLIFKLVRCLDSVQKAMPKIEKASQLYISDHEPKE